MIIDKEQIGVYSFSELDSKLSSLSNTIQFTLKRFKRGVTEPERNLHHVSTRIYVEEICLN